MSMMYPRRYPYLYVIYANPVRPVKFVIIALVVILALTAQVVSGQLSNSSACLDARFYVYVGTKLYQSLYTNGSVSLLNESAQLLLKANESLSTGDCVNALLYAKEALGIERRVLSTINDTASITSSQDEVIRAQLRALLIKSMVSGRSDLALRINQYLAGNTRINSSELSSLVLTVEDVFQGYERNYVETNSEHYIDAKLHSLNVEPVVRLGLISNKATWASLGFYAALNKSIIKYMSLETKCNGALGVAALSKLANSLSNSYPGIVVRVVSSINSSIALGIANDCLLRINSQLSTGNLTSLLLVANESYSNIKTENEALLSLSLTLPQLGAYEDSALRVVNTTLRILRELENETVAARVGNYMASIYSEYKVGGSLGLRNYLVNQVSIYMNYINTFKELIGEIRSKLGNSFPLGITVELPQSLLMRILELRNITLITIPIEHDYCETPVIGIIKLTSTDSVDAASIVNASYYLWLANTYCPMVIANLGTMQSLWAYVKSGLGVNSSINVATSGGAINTRISGEAGISVGLGS